jgi:hypothetical protein
VHDTGWLGERDVKWYGCPVLEKFPMTETETRTTATFEVDGDDGSIETVIEQTTFLIHKGDNHRAPVQVDWHLNGDDLIRDASDHRVFRKAPTGETFRRIKG